MAHAASTSGSTAVSLLAADGPAEGLADKLMLFGRFVGAWDVESTSFQPDGTRRERIGEWRFAWVLGGRAIQDVLFEKGASPDRYGTTIRAYDERADTWHVSWMAPAWHEYVHLVARAVGDRIVLEGAGSDPARRERWSFNEITDDSFVWRGEASFDEGETWILEQEIRARRRRES
ncbi:MAG: hypothetical protein ABSB96_06360 [Gaiellaceae bacterium]